MKKDLASRLWSWSIHTGDTLFSEAADEIENLKQQLSNSYSKVFKNSENLNKELNDSSTELSRELDIVEELTFFAEAADSDAIVVTMLSGNLFLEAAQEIENLRSLIIAWADADDDPKDIDGPYHAAWLSLRKAVGR